MNILVPQIAFHVEYIIVDPTIYVWIAMETVIVDICLFGNGFACF